MDEGHRLAEGVLLRVCEVGPLVDLVDAGEQRILDLPEHLDICCIPDSVVRQDNNLLA